MTTTTLSTKWFTIYFAGLGILLIGCGIFLILKKEAGTTFILEATDHGKPPRLLVRILKYLLLFTLPGLILSFTPFSWIELLFTLWSLLLVYIAGIQLVRWNERRAIIKSQAKNLPNIIHRSGAIMVAVGSALLLLAYWVIKQASF